MKKFGFIHALMLLPLLLACGPSVYTMSLDLREPSGTGYDFTGKSIGIVYVYGREAGDSLFAASMSEGLASGLEMDYFNSETVIPLYTMPYTEGANYRDKDTLLNLICGTNNDVVFVLDSPKFANLKYGDVTSTQTCSASFSYEQYIYVMDSYDKADTVKAFRASSNYSVNMDVEGVMTSEDLLARTYSSTTDHAQLAGERIAGNFTPKWVKEEHGIYFYDNEKWLEAADLTADLKFREALDKWMDLMETREVAKKASAAYNAAFCCYMLKEYALASEWLEISNDYMELPRTAWLNRKIVNRINTK